MVQQPRRRKRRRKFLGSHQRAWIWGRYPVLETLKAGKWKPYELMIAEGVTGRPRAEVDELAGRMKIEVTTVVWDALNEVCGTAEHQGYAARMPEFEYADFDEVIDKFGPTTLIGILDSIQDPFNFGAILRSADAMGFDAIFIPSRGQTGVTSQVVRSSAGAACHIPIVRLEDFIEVVAGLSLREGFQVVAASEKEGVSPSEIDFRRPTAIVIGNEGTGIRADILKYCPLRASIPQFGHVGSLNAAVSAGILFYEARRQRTAAAP
jgi:23S rRNA (guanosine2251-2'-O)-methyltransferase